MTNWSSLWWLIYPDIISLEIYPDCDRIRVRLNNDKKDYLISTFFHSRYGLDFSCFLRFRVLVHLWSSMKSFVSGFKFWNHSDQIRSDKIRSDPWFLRPMGWMLKRTDPNLSGYFTKNWNLSGYFIFSQKSIRILFSIEIYPTTFQEIYPDISLPRNLSGYFSA